MKPKTDKIELLCVLIEQELLKAQTVRKEVLAKQFKSKEKDIVAALSRLHLRGKVSRAVHTVCPDWTFYTNKKGKQAKRKCWHPDCYDSKIYQGSGA